MTLYYDTGILLKLYTPESESPTVSHFVREAGQAIPFLSLHRTECTSALHLKAFRGECTVAQANRALADLNSDLRRGVLMLLQPDWESLWEKARQLCEAHSAHLGCRTLDTLHVAAALLFAFGQFATSDARQSALAERVGLTVINPAAAND